MKNKSVHNGQFFHRVKFQCITAMRKSLSNLKLKGGEEVEKNRGCVMKVSCNKKCFRNFHKTMF